MEEQRRNTPESICWNITKQCNERCEFCYRDNTSNDLSIKDNMKILCNMIESGVKKITFAGGEPLLYPATLELIQYAHQNGVITSMTTNGILVTDEVLNKCEGILDWFTLSLDGSNSEMQTNMTRHAGHFDNVVKIINSIEKRELDIGVKINTIISCINKNDIVKMIDFIRKHKILRWKLFQFVPLRGSALEAENKFYISDEEYNRVVKKVREGLKMYELEDILSISSREAIENAYFVVFPNGDVRLSQQLSDKYIGNLLKNDVNEIWEHNNFNKELHIERTNRAIKIIKGE